MRVLNKQEWYHIRDAAKNAGVEFVKYQHEYFHVTSKIYPTGESPLWSVEQVFPVDAAEITEWWEDG